MSYDTIAQVRHRAERRLVAWLREQAPHDDPSDRRDRDVEIRAVHAATITAAARQAAQPSTGQLNQSRTVIVVGGQSSKNVRGRVSKKTPKSGVEGRGKKATAPAHTTPPSPPTASTRRPSDMTSEVPRCA